MFVLFICCNLTPSLPLSPSLHPLSLPPSLPPSLRFSLSVEIFDLQSSLLHLYAAVMGSMDRSQSISVEQIRCKLVPLVPSIQDSATLYDLIFKLMKALHACKEGGRGRGGERGRGEGDRERERLLFVFFLSSTDGNTGRTQRKIQPTIPCVSFSS